MKEFMVSYFWNGKRYSENILANSQILASCEFMERILRDTTSMERIQAKFCLCN